MEKILQAGIGFAFIVFFSSLHGQIIPSIEWQKSFGGSGDDEPYCIGLTSDGGSIVAGYSFSNDGDVAGNHSTVDYWVVRLDATGNLLWQKCYGGSDDDYGSAIQQTADGGFIVGGYSESSDGDVSASHGEYDFWILKLDSVGNLQWQKSLGGSADEKLFSIHQTSDGGYIAGGLSYSNDGDVTGNHGLSDYWIVKLNADGNLVWQKSLGGSGDERIYSVVESTDGKYVAGGWSQSNDGNVTGHHGSVDYPDYWIVKLNTNGNLIWQKSLGGTNQDLVYSLQQTNDGGFIVGGASYSNNGNVSGNHGNADYWIAKLNASGSLAWQKSLGGSASDLVYSLKQTSDGGYIVAGWCNSNDGDVTGNHEGYDYWILKLGSSGNLLWQKSFGGSDNDRANSIQQTPDGGFIVAGYSNSIDGDVTGNHGSYDYWIMKLTCDEAGTYYADADGDGFGNANSTLLACPPPSGYVVNGDDCNDANSSVHPGVAEVCGNNVDDNCDGFTDADCNSITVGTISGSPFCPEATVNISFTSTGFFNAGNIYSAELSDKQGSFNSPVIIGTLVSNANSGSVVGTIPSSPLVGSKYRIRVTSNNPVVTGTKNSSNLKLIACAPVSSLSVSGVTSLSATINWSGVSCAAKYKIQYRKQGTTTWTTKYSTANSYTFSSLHPNTTYEYHLNTFCSESGSSSSGYTTIKTFNTSLRLSSDLATEGVLMSIYPNPVDEQAIIRFTLQQPSYVIIKAYDMTGKEIQTVLNDEEEQGEHLVLLDASDFLKGVYFVKMISDFGVQTQKLIVQ